MKMGFVYKWSPNHWLPMRRNLTLRCRSARLDRMCSQNSGKLHLLRWALSTLSKVCHMRVTSSRKSRASC